MDDVDLGELINGFHYGLLALLLTLRPTSDEKAFADFSHNLAMSADYLAGIPKSGERGPPD